MVVRWLVMFAAAAFAIPASAQDMSAFRGGPVFGNIGMHAPVAGIGEMPADTEFAIAFDVSEASEFGERNRSIDSAARFINMHVAHGVPEDNIRIAVVVHGKAVVDLTTDAAWAARGHAAPNPSDLMVRAMLDHGVRFIVCGQSAQGLGVSQDQLIPGVEMALSAMTAHALLQQNGFTMNPF